MRRATITGLVALSLAGLAINRNVTGAALQASSDDLGAAAAGCPATPIVGVDPPPGERGNSWIYGDGIWTEDFGGPVAAVALHLKRNGTLSIKFQWWRDSRVHRTKGKLRVRGRRWPGGDHLLRFHQTPGFTVPKAKFRASHVTFPGPGCWWMSAKAGNARLHFVLWVIRAAN